MKDDYKDPYIDSEEFDPKAFRLTVFITIAIDALILSGLWMIFGGE